MSEKEVEKWKHNWNQEAVKIEKALEILDKAIKQFEEDKDDANAFDEKRAAYACAAAIRFFLDLRECLVPENTKKEIP
jgi:hypothetical protein